MELELKPYSKSDEIKRWIPSVIIGGLAIYFLMNWGKYGLLDNIDLVIHEAGHFFFILFGKFMYTLGGTLMQLIIPFIIVWYFFNNGYKTGMQFGLMWLGQNLINISVYASDAQERKLPLLGGNKVYHDWHYMLGELNILKWDAEVGYLFTAGAVIVFLVAILLPLIYKE